ncbi:MAG: DGQHR domain-containing protein [Pseudolabrys sp.]
MAKAKQRRVPALRVEQWLKPWDKVSYDAKKHRAKPEPYFFIFSLPAAELRSLCGIFRRQTNSVSPRSADLGIQRQHDPERSEEISRFVEFGYPWSTLSEAKRQSQNYNDLRKPGWLPTAIVINILNKGEKREGKAISNDDVVTVAAKPGVSEIELPYDEWTKDWEASGTPPFEVIDGQHRLWAFDPDEASTSKFEVPIVAFHGLDVSWQAYLFWTINIKPKRINPSLAFDLYPLLRSEDWLERSEEHIVYRDTRSQELTEALWSYSGSPWYDRINMLGERKIKGITQNAWIRGLSASFVKPWDGRQGRTGGLFGERFGTDGEVLRWSRAQQAAFLIYAWQQLRSAINDSDAEWVVSLRKSVGISKTAKIKPEDEPGFYSTNSLIATDQGMRGFLQTLNDVCYVQAPKLKLNDWILKPASGPVQDAAIASALKSIDQQAVAKTIKAFAKSLAEFDWRTSSDPSLSAEQRQLKLGLRGSGGYKELRRLLLSHLVKHGSEAVRDTAKNLLKTAG